MIMHRHEVMSGNLPAEASAVFLSGNFAFLFKTATMYADNEV